MSLDRGKWLPSVEWHLEVRRRFFVVCSDARAPLMVTSGRLVCSQAEAVGCKKRPEDRDNAHHAAAHSSE